MAPATKYDPRFYDAIRPGCQASARAVAPVVSTLLDVRTVVDVGGGEGWWADAFASEGAVPLVLDGGGHDAANAPQVLRCDVDLAAPFELGEVFDMAVCLEVAEHLPPQRGPGFVADLCRLAPVVLFSAAMPGQGGTGHVNCQPPAYWASLFAGHGYACSGGLRWLIWDDDRVEPWYRSNLLLFDATGSIDRALFTGPANGPLHVQHPDLWIPCG